MNALTHQAVEGWIEDSLTHFEENGTIAFGFVLILPFNNMAFQGAFDAVDKIGTNSWEQKERNFLGI